MTEEKKYLISHPLCAECLRKGRYKQATSVIKQAKGQMKSVCAEHMAGRKLGIVCTEPLEFAWDEWNRIERLANAIACNAHMHDSSPDQCKSWAKEIIMQCDIITEAKEVEQNHA